MDSKRRRLLQCSLGLAPPLAGLAKPPSRKQAAQAPVPLAV